MQHKPRTLEIQTPDGQVILKVVITEQDDSGKESPENPAAKAPERREPAGGDSDGELMSGAQKRYLFRLLALGGIEGDKAYEELKRLFQVSTLVEVSKRDASTAIEKLLANNKGGKENGSPLK